MLTNELADIGISRARITTIPSGIDIPNRWRQATSSNTHREARCALPNLLYVGRVVHEKNLILALEAIALLKKDGWKGEFDVVGDGSALKQVRDAAQSLGIGDLVKFWGEVKREDLWSFYSNARLFVFPSRTETQGLVLSEAAWFGLPSVVVDADSTFLSQLEQGVFTSSPNPEALKAVIASVIDDPAPLIRTGTIAQAEVQALERAAGSAFVQLIRENMNKK